MGDVCVIGIDPGLVHTGVVEIGLYPEQKESMVDYEVFDGCNAAAIQAVYDWIKGRHYDHIFIEAYRPRSHYQNDARMGAAVNALRSVLKKSSSLDNNGVKGVIKPDLMKLLGIWKFSQTTHHQDLRAAARIGLYGLVKNEEWNKILAQLVQDHVDGKDWVRV